MGIRIALVAQEFFPVPPIRGGAVEALIEEMAIRLQGHEVHIFGIADPQLPLRETKEHRTYHRWQPTWFDRVLLSSWKLPFKQSRSRWYYWPYSRWVAGQLKRLQPDIVHVMSRMPFVPWLRRAVPEAAIVLSVHQLSSLQGERVWSDRSIACCDVITGVSRFMADEIMKRYPSTRSKVRVLRNGIDLDAYRPWRTQQTLRERVRRARGLGSGPVILYAGRLVEQKGVHVLAEAFQRLMADWDKRQETRDKGRPTLVIVGSHTYSDPTQTDYIKQLKQRLQPLGSQVVWTGYVAPEDVLGWYAASDVVVVPSIGPESFSMVTLEAMATGLPVIAFDHGGPRELLSHHETGWLVNLNEGSEGMAKAFEVLLADEALRRRLGLAARRRAEQRFSWQAVMPDTVGLYEEAVRAHRSSTRGAPRVRVLLAESGTGYGGSAKYLSELVARLDPMRYDVWVSAAALGPFIQQIKAKGIPVIERPWWVFPWEEPLTGTGDRGQETGDGGPGTKEVSHVSCLMSRMARLLYLMKSISQLIVTVPMIALWLSRRRIQLVHLNNEILSQLPLLLAAKLARCRVICHLQGWRAFTRIERWAVRFVDEIVCISYAGATYYQEQLPGRHVRAIPHAIEWEGHAASREALRVTQRRRLGLEPSDLLVTVVGRLVPWKGQAVFLKALAKAKAQKPHLRGLIVGHDPSPTQSYLRTLQDLARELGMAEAVQFLDWQEDVWALYAASDVIVHASTEPEPFGLIVIEAMAAGTPVVATKAGGVVDIVVDGSTGLLVEPRDVDALATAIIRLLENRALTAQLTRQATETVRTSFTMERNAAQVMEVYEQLLDDAVAPLPRAQDGV